MNQRVLLTSCMSIICMLISLDSGTGAKKTKLPKVEDAIKFIEKITNMSVKEKSDRILSLFENLTTLSRHQLPVEERDKRLVHIGHLPRGTLFSGYHEKHLQEATELFKIFFAAKDFDDFIKLATQARDIVNEGLFAYAFSVSVVHRDDCKGVTLPPIQEVFPDRFISAETIKLALKEAKNHPSKDVVVKMEQTGNILDPEYKMAYFFEDIGINAHHWHWHVVNPANWSEEFTHILKDRKGELFYHMLQQICARCDSDRLSNGLNRAVPFHNLEERLGGYAPHLTSLVSGLHYASRPQGLSLGDFEESDVQEMEKWRKRIIEAIDFGFVHGANGSKIPLDVGNGTNTLGALIEPSSSSLNKDFYGSLQSTGHVLISRMHDPDGRFQENPGVMSDTSTAFRDPIFCRFHRFVDDIFQQHKATLKPYTKKELSFEGIKVVSVQLNAVIPNVIATFFKEENLNLHHGINFGTGQKVSVKYHHLDHEPFSFIINIENNSGAVKYATIRVFLGPKYDELGKRLAPNEKKRLMIELDKFPKELAPGTNVFNRSSIESSVTLAHTYSFDELRAGKGRQNVREYGNCGWPKHMLVPKGQKKGMEFELFVMATDYTVDSPQGSSVKTTWSDAVSYCGAKDQKYPDKKPLGFPFDRNIEDRTADELLTENMSVTDVKIKFKG